MSDDPSGLMVFPDDDPGHWSRVVLWSGLAALTYPLLWLAFYASDMRDLEASYVSFLTDGLVSFLTVLIGSALAIHYAAKLSARLPPFRAVVYASVIAWLAVTIAVAWSLSSTPTDTDTLAALVASPFLVVIAAPGFFVLAVAVWTERMFIHGRQSVFRRAETPFAGKAGIAPGAADDQSRKT